MKEMKQEMKQEVKTDSVSVPKELWSIIMTWPAIISRARTSSSNLLVTMKEMQDLEQALPMIEKMKNG
jgi:hypothetical protein